MTILTSSRTDLLERVSPAQWQIACDRERVIRPILKLQRGRRASAVAAAAQELGCSLRKIYALVAAFEKDPRPSSLLLKQEGRPKADVGPGSAAEVVRARKIEIVWLTEVKPEKPSLVPGVAAVCNSAAKERPEGSTSSYKAFDLVRGKFATAGARNTLLINSTPSDPLSVERSLLNGFPSPTKSRQLPTGCQPWPVTPSPLLHETLNSWLFRIAVFHEVSWDDLLQDFSPDCCVDTDFDLTPPTGFAEWLSAKTHVPASDIRGMSLTAFVPTILDGLTPETANLTSYIGVHRVLSDPTEPLVKYDAVPWFDRDWMRRWGCRQCLLAAGIAYSQLSWLLPWMLTCAAHGCFLEKLILFPGLGWEPLQDPTIRVRLLGGSVFPRRPPTAAHLRLDRVTWQALTTNKICWQGVEIESGRWLRTVRTTIEELMRIRADPTSLGSRMLVHWDSADVVPPDLSGALYERLKFPQRALVMAAAAEALR